MCSKEHTDSISDDGVAVSGSRSTGCSSNIYGKQCCH